MRRERCHGEKDSLEHDANGEKNHPAEPGGGERQGAETSDHHRVGNSHRHLREIGGGQRRRQREGRPQLRANAQPRATVKPLIVWIDRLHLALSNLHHGAPPLSERDLRKRKGPDRIGGAPYGRVLVVFSARAYPQAPRQSRAGR